MAPCTHTYIHMHTGSPTESHSDLCNRPPCSLHPGADHSAQYSRNVGEAGRDLLVCLSAPLHYRGAHVKCGDCASHSPPARRIFSHRRCSSACPQHSVRRPRPSRWAQVGKHHQCPAVPRATRGAGAEEGQQGGEPGRHPGRRSGEAPRTLQGPQAGEEVFALLPRSQGEEEVSRNLFTGSPWTPLSPTLPSPLTFFSLLSWNRAQRINCDP